MNAPSTTGQLASLQIAALFTGVAGSVLSICGAFFNAKQFFISYLFAYLFWVGLALGCLGFLLVHHLAGGRWGFPVRRIFEAAIMTLPLLALLLVPVCLGLHDLYSWTDPATVAASPPMQHRSHYMTGPAFILRAAIFFAFWIAVAIALNKWSFEQDSTKDAAPTRKLRTLSGPCMVLYPVMATFVLVDWVLSLEPDWFSTMFLVLIVIGQMLTGLTFGIVLLAWLRKTKPLSEIVTTTQFQHMGMLLLAFVMLWTYMAFGEFLIIYSGNEPREIGWYLHRIAGNWKAVVWFLFLFHFLIPFFLLLSRNLKRNIPALAWVAATVFFAHSVDTYWLVAPSFFQHGIHFHWLDVTTFAGLGGIWMTAFSARLRSRSLIVLNDVRQHLAP